MNAPPDQPVALLCTWWGGDDGNRTFDILVDGERIATQTLASHQPGQFFDATYPIPDPLTRGKTRVEVRFQAHPGNLAGGLFGLRMVRAE
jgi:hypothetical protein